MAIAITIKGKQNERYARGHAIAGGSEFNFVFSTERTGEMTRRFSVDPCRSPRKSMVVAIRGAGAVWGDGAMMRLEE
jgi:hypothetical protein